MHIAEEWAIENGLPMYDLGGGESSPDGYITVDMLEGSYRVSKNSVVGFVVVGHQAVGIGDGNGTE